MLRSTGSLAEADARAGEDRERGEEPRCGPRGSPSEEAGGRSSRRRPTGPKCGRTQRRQRPAPGQRGGVWTCCGRRSCSPWKRLPPKRIIGEVLQALAEEAMHAAGRAEAVVVHPDDQDKLSDWVGRRVSTSRRTRTFVWGCGS